MRQGDSAAFGVLYGRYVAVAGYVARAETDNSSDAEDVVAEAFAAVLEALSAGKGPRESFQAYLTTTVRRMAHRRNIRSRRTATLGYGSAMDVLVLDDNSSIRVLESTIMMRAFRSLPVRWRAVLWCVEVEGLKPAATGRVMELSPNGVSSLLIRAREGLRQAYLQEHIAQAPNDPCVDFSRHLGKFVRNAVRKAARERVDHHVADCRRCADSLDYLKEIDQAMSERPKSGAVTLALGWSG
ncbi:RNA polymerase sigma factor [Arthrobacter sp. 18067]|uniref:RNA polymerase sigma factor n=1 Tax=Arthrobacter sp. 18067 TaxID=2681413 RepID=UPI0013580B4A|nr:sigma-70 family RNA polymerase sigma factor [Arthrobacter sp. 18067]